MQLPLTPHRGVVKFYDANRLFGFIIPDISRDDKKDTYFHRDNGRDVRENLETHKLDLYISAALQRSPKPGDKVIYIANERQRGPTAIGWTYEVLWNTRNSLIAARVHPNLLPCRVMSDEGETPQILWKGTRAEFDYWIGTLPSMPPGIVRLEQCLAHGWAEVPWPSDAS